MMFNVELECTYLIWLLRSGSEGGVLNFTLRASTFRLVSLSKMQVVLEPFSQFWMAGLQPVGLPANALLEARRVIAVARIKFFIV